MTTTTLLRSAPVFATTDLARALGHDERLGFAAGVERRFHRPTPTDDGLVEGATSTSDGNLLRFGSPAGAPAG